MREGREKESLKKKKKKDEADTRCCSPIGAISRLQLPRIGLQLSPADKALASTCSQDKKKSEKTQLER